jgi:hypothetical protein
MVGAENLLAKGKCPLEQHLGLGITPFMH